MEDLEAAGFAAKAGTGPDIQQVLKANASRAAELGLDSGHRKISWESKGAVPQNLHQENMALWNGLLTPVIPELALGGYS